MSIFSGGDVRHSEGVHHINVDAEHLSIDSSVRTSFRHPQTMFS